MEQKLINLISEIRVLSNQMAQTFVLEIATKEMTIENWNLLSEGMVLINEKVVEVALISSAHLISLQCTPGDGETGIK